MVELAFIDKNGTSGVIHNDFSVESLGSVDEELHAFVDSVDVNYSDESPRSLEEISDEFIIDLYTHTRVQEVEIATQTPPAAWCTYRGGIVTRDQADYLWIRCPL